MGWGEAAGTPALLNFSRQEPLVVGCGYRNAVRFQGTAVFHERRIKQDAFF